MKSEQLIRAHFSKFYKDNSRENNFQKALSRISLELITAKQKLM